MTATRLARAASAWFAAAAAGALASRWPAAGAILGAAGGAWALARRRLPGTAILAGLSAVAAAALLPALALARDPFHALRPSTAWPILAVVLASLGTGALCWIPPQAATPHSEPIPSSPNLRRALLWELGALALLLPLGIAGTQLALALLLGTLGWALARGARAAAAPTLGGPVAALLVAALLSIALAAQPTPPWHTTALRALAAFFVLGWTLQIVRPTRREILRLVGLWVAASAAVSALAFCQHWSGFDLLAALRLRVAIHVPAPESPGHVAGVGTFASRLTFAHATLVPAAILVGLELSREVRGLGWAAALGLEFLGLWATFARAAWMAAAAIAVAAALLSFAARERARLLAGVAGALGAVAALFALSPGARAWGLAGLDPAANRDRLFLWARAVQIALDHPWRGVGLGSYQLVLGPYYDRLDPTFPMRTWAHDVPLSLLCETGPLGLFAYLWLIAEGLSLARRRGAEFPGGLALGGALAVLAFAVVSLFHDVLYDGQVMYNLFFALALASWMRGRFEPSVAVL